MSMGVMLYVWDIRYVSPLLQDIYDIVFSFFDFLL